MWRAETQGSYFLVFNSILNFDHLNAGYTPPAASAPAASKADADNQE
jgi:hypothetical protein